MEQPPSPGTKLVELGECLESLLHFTLRSHLDERVFPSLDLKLPRDFCLHLLEEEDTESKAIKNRNWSGEKRHTWLKFQRNVLSTEKPAMYKLLATALCVCLTSEKQELYSKLFNGLGNDLVNMLKSVNFELHVQEPYFTQLKDGLKTVEGRCAVGDYMRITTGASILFNKCLLLEVQGVHHYASFSEMLREEGLAKVLPGIESIEDGVRVYRNFYPEEKERINGVVAILVAKPVQQPYAALAGILCELKPTGITKLMDDYTTRVVM